MNIQIFEFLNSFAGQNPLRDQLIVFLASYLPYVLIVAAVIFLFWHTENKKGKLREIFFVFVVALLAWLLATLIKNLVHTLRPYAVLDAVYKLFQPNDIFSFPSGHATFFAALATSLYLRHKKVGLIFALGALLIGLARIVSGVHFPLDILGGFALGLGLAYLVDSFFKKG